MKSTAIIRIILFSLAILILGSILFAALVFDTFMARTDSYAENMEPTSGQITKESFSTDIRNIEIDWVAGDIYIVESPQITEIFIAETMNNDVEEKMVCRQSGQTLKIQFCEESLKLSGFGIDADIQKDLTIRVPADWNCESLEIDAAATNVTVQDLTIWELDFDGASGKLTLDNCDIGDLEIDTASGDVEFSGMLQELKFDAASGKFDGKFYQTPKKLTLNALSGDMRLELPQDSGFSLDYDAMSSSFDCDFDVKSSSDHHYVSGDGSCKIKISALSGDVTIQKSTSEPKNYDN